jgi:hypothetical protein
MDPKELGLKAEKKRHVERLKEIEKVQDPKPSPPNSLPFIPAP